MVGCAVRCRGFTTIELLVVMAIISTLVVLIAGVGGGVRERGRTARAEGEVAALTHGLEVYRAHFGDYPYCPPGSDRGKILREALEGRRLPDGRAVESPFPSPVLALENFQVSGGRFGEGVLLDPWEQPYEYFYRASATDPTWLRTGFLLFSPGASEDLARDGTVDAGLFDNPHDGVRLVAQP